MWIRPTKLVGNSISKRRGGSGITTAEGYYNLELFTKTGDTSNAITASGASVSAVAAPDNERGYIYYDFGANWLTGDYTFEFEITLDGSAASGSAEFGLWLSEEQNDFEGTLTADLSDAHGTFIREGTDRQYHYYAMAGSSTITDYYNIITGTTYYVTLGRDDDGGANGTGQLTQVVRTTSHTGTIVDNNSRDILAGQGGANFRYLCVGTNYKNAGDSNNSTIANIKLVSP